MDARKQLAKAKFRDRLARRIIVLGGIGIILSMMTMVVFMFKVTLPLFGEPETLLRRQLKTEAAPETTVLFQPGPYLERALVINSRGILDILDLSNQEGAVLETISLLPEGEAGGAGPAGGAGLILERAEKVGSSDIALYWSDGSASLIEFEVRAIFDEKGDRGLRFEWQRHGHVPALAQTAEKSGAAAVLRGHKDDHGLTFVQVTGPGTLSLRRTTETEDFMGDRETQTLEGSLSFEAEADLTGLALDDAGKRLWAATGNGELLLWDLSDIESPQLLARERAFEDQRKITCINLMLGQVSLAVGDERGGLTIWDYLPANPPRLAKIHDLRPHRESVIRLKPSSKDKTLASMDRTGEIFLSHITSERKLVSLQHGPRSVDMALSERGDGLMTLDERSHFRLYELKIPHPEISWRALWGKVWYESYPEPSYTWQSSSASDDFEPKLSLMPLLWGSLKGTFYGMLFSLPLAIFGAMYVSHLMNPRWRVVIKPIVELMAAVPTVVIGFLAALWLAPRFEENLLGVILALVTIPIFVAAGMMFLRRRARTRGKEFLWAVPLAIIAVFVAVKVGFWVQDTWFGSNLNLWLFQRFNLAVDQRNCVVISFALGFAVIPIIFTISEDALHNVPKHITAAALALGSSRWQTLRRVVLPMASPGIFAAVMIGFGRAVGETMIVLMATGNTPIMSPSILNGMRTLSANIAVEIPEAPVDSTLFRILFLSALLLFILTFVVNTLAEGVRHYLRKRYRSV